MLGCFLAGELGMSRILVPHRPGVVSALGGLVADLKSDFIQTVFLDTDPGSASALKEGFAALAAEGEKWLRAEHGFEGPASLQLSAEMRYQGQSFEIEVPLERSWIESGDIGAIRGAFHRLHAAIYDFNDESAPVQIVNLRLVVSGATPRPPLDAAPAGVGDPAPAAFVELWLDGERKKAPHYRRADLAPGHRFAGPAVVTQEDATVAIPRAFSASVDAHLNLHLEAGAL